MVASVSDVQFYVNCKTLFVAYIGELSARVVNTFLCYTEGETHLTQPLAICNSRAIRA
jgi:hypothetical protein